MSLNCIPRHEATSYLAIGSPNRLSRCICAIELLAATLHGRRARFFSFSAAVSIILMTAADLLPPLRAAKFDLIWFSAVVITIGMRWG